MPSPKSMFLDSGAFSLRPACRKWMQETGGTEEDYYNTPEFYQYLDRYVEFVTEHALGIDCYANVDVIGHPYLSWRNQLYLERKGLTPVPVVHFPTPVRWFRRYIEAGHKYIGLGGLIGNQRKCGQWLDEIFDMTCGPDRLPTIKLHGFAVTSYRLMVQYPWYSVDSATWTKRSAFGGILVPHKRRGRFSFEDDPYCIYVTDKAPQRKAPGQHYRTLKRGERLIVDEWLELIEVSMEGLIDSYKSRAYANLMFFWELQDSLPEWPWAFNKIPKGF